LHFEPSSLPPLKKPPKTNSLKYKSQNKTTIIAAFHKMKFQFKETLTILEKEKNQPKNSLK
jgi:hypothetical protein